MTQNRTIAVRFQPQQWINDYATDCEPESLFDVTERVLLMPLEQIHQLRNSSDSSDDLCPSNITAHDGPYYVVSEEAICAFFGTEDIAEVTADQLAQGLAEFSLRGIDVDQSTHQR